MPVVIIIIILIFIATYIQEMQLKVLNNKEMTYTSVLHVKKNRKT